MEADATPNPTQTPAGPPAASDAVSRTTPGELAGSSWFDALTGRGPESEDAAFSGAVQEPPDEQADQPEPGAPGSEDADEGTGDREQGTGPAPKQQTEPGPDDVVRMTRTQYERRVQSEVDRILAKQQRDAQKRQQQEAARAQKEALLQRAEQDPVGFSDDFLAQQRSEQDLEAQLAPVHEAIRGAVTQYDQAIVNPVMHALPPEIGQKLVADIQPVGVEGRGKLVAAALTELRKAERSAGRAEGEKAAEAKLRRSAAFRKELLAELRGSEDEPELLPGNGASPQPTDMDDWIRAAAHARMS